MKNKVIKIIFILITCLNFSYLISADEFEFKVTEAEIVDNGNIYKGLSGGTATTDNNIIITADYFEYNKRTSLLEAKGNVILDDKNKKIIIKSNEVFYLKDKEEIYTKGKSKAFNNDNIEIDADEFFRYNKLSSILEAKGNVKLLDTKQNITIKSNQVFYNKNKEEIYTKGKTHIDIDNSYDVNGSNLFYYPDKMILSSDYKTDIKEILLNNFYELGNFKYSINDKILKGKKIILTTNYQKPKNDKYFFEKSIFDFKKKKFLAKDVKIKFDKLTYENEKNDPRLNGVSASGNEFQTNLNKGTFTTCKKNDKCPPWTIKAVKIKHDKIKKRIIYENAWLNIYNVPVVYFPKFFHPDPTVIRQSGFLKPDLGNSNDLGDSIYTPYFYVLSDNRDLTIKPRIYENNKFVLQNEYRQDTKNTYTIIDFSYAKGHTSSSEDLTKNSRTHFFSNTTAQLNLDNFLSSDLEISIQKTSNDTYLKRFNLFEPIGNEITPLKPASTKVLESKIKLNLGSENYYLTTSFQSFETLDGLSSDRFEYVLPSYELTRSFNLKNLNGYLSFNSNGNNYLKNTNVMTTNIANNLNYTSFDKYFDNGIKSNFYGLFRNLNSIGKNDKNYEESPQGDIISSYIYNLSYPLIKEEYKSSNLLTPKMSLRFSPHEMKNHRGTSKRINIDNIYNNDRLALGDSFEEGGSLTFGFDYKKEIEEIEDYFEIKLATILRNKEKRKIPDNSTLGGKQSNIFGQVNYNATKNISLNYDFSVKEDLNTFEYNAIDAKFTYENFFSDISFIEEDGKFGSSNMIEHTTGYNFDEYNSIKFNTRRNRKINLTEFYDLIYQYKNDCLTADLKYKKTYYSDNDVKPVQELFFTISIVPLTTFSPDKILLK